MSILQYNVYPTFPHPPANPMLTTYYVKGKIPYEAMFPYGTAEEILAKYPCNLHSGVGITALDAARRELTLTTGEKKQYDKILIATGKCSESAGGGHPRRPHFYHAHRPRC